MTIDSILRRTACNPAYRRLYDQLLTILTEVEYGDILPPPPALFDIERDEQRVVVEVCKLPGMSADYWNTLDEFSREPWLRRAVAELERSPTPSVQPTLTSTPVSTPPATVPPATTRKGRGGRNWDAPAVAVFLDHPDWTNKQIAAHLRCNEKSLAPKRCPKLKAARMAAKYTAAPPLGTKTKDGRVEAGIDDE